MGIYNKEHADIDLASISTTMSSTGLFASALAEHANGSAAAPAAPVAPPSVVESMLAQILESVQRQVSRCAQKHPGCLTSYFTAEP